MINFIKGFGKVDVYLINIRIIMARCFKGDNIVISYGAVIWDVIYNMNIFIRSLR